MQQWDVCGEGWGGPVHPCCRAHTAASLPPQCPQCRGPEERGSVLEEDGASPAWVWAQPPEHHTPQSGVGRVRLLLYSPGKQRASTRTLDYFIYIAF